MEFSALCSVVSSIRSCVEKNQLYRGFEKKSEEDDLVIEEHGVKMVVDSYSADYLKDANIDYIESLMGAGFKINNPNVTKSCSCGHSFSTS